MLEWKSLGLPGVEVDDGGSCSAPLGELMRVRCDHAPLAGRSRLRECVGERSLERTRSRG